MRIGIATDHGGFWLEEELIVRLRAAGHEIEDFGAHALNSVDDYPDFVIPLARSAAAGEVERGVAVCGSAWGASTTRDLRSASLNCSGSSGSEPDQVIAAAKKQLGRF